MNRWGLPGGPAPLPTPPRMTPAQVAGALQQLFVQAVNQKKKDDSYEGSRRAVSEQQRRETASLEPVRKVAKAKSSVRGRSVAPRPISAV